MSNLVLTIGGRNFTVACAAGEEDHVSMLGQMIDGKLRSMDGIAGQGESRMLLFAALLLADELHEARSASEPAPAESMDGERLLSIAEKLENLAASLEAQ